MRQKRSSLSSPISPVSIIVSTSRALSAAAFTMILSISILAQSTVEKAETRDRARNAEDSVKLAQEAVKKPEERQTPPETGRLIGDYSVTSSMELGYRFVDTDGSHERYLSDVNVRDGARVLDYSLDMRSLTGKGLLFDFLRADATNLGGDAQQYISLRAEKARAYNFDAKVRRFNYFRVLPTTANSYHNLDLRQQYSDLFLKLLPQRPVRVNLGYSRGVAKGPAGGSYSFESNIFSLPGQARWETNDYRLGIDATWKRWTFLVDETARYLRNDTFVFADSELPFIFTSATRRSRINFIDRDDVVRSKAFITRASAQGSITNRLHLVVRALRVDERLRYPAIETTSGLNNSGVPIVNRLQIASGFAERPTRSFDAALTYDIGEHFHISNTFTYYGFDIFGDNSVRTTTTTQPATGQPVTTIATSLASRTTNLDQYRNTLEGRYATRRLTANLGYRYTTRDITLIRPEDAAAARDDVSQNTHTVIGGLRVRPVQPLNLFFDVEHGTRDNAFVRVDQIDFTRYRLRANLQATDKLSFTATYTQTDSRNPVPAVRNESNFKGVSASANWEPNERFYLSAGYSYDELFSEVNIRYQLSGQTRSGISFYYARLNYIFADARVGLTNRLDLLFVYRYLHDRGAPSGVALNPGDDNFVTELPLRRHNPEARLAYRFSRYFTGNISYRHYSYNERLAFIEDYRANLLTISGRFNF